MLDYGQAPLRLGGEDVTATYVCMELMEGGNLADRLVKGRHVPADEVAAWLDDLSAALDYAHQQGIVHSGLKPTPIVFDGNGGVYVTDFAIASRPGDTRTQAFLGAPDFLAPEQWEGADARAATRPVRAGRAQLPGADR
jgi:serine/threonine-protein kinase